MIFRDLEWWPEPSVGPVSALWSWGLTGCRAGLVGAGAPRGHNFPHKLLNLGRVERHQDITSGHPIDIHARPQLFCAKSLMCPGGSIWNTARTRSAFGTRPTAANPTIGTRAVRICPVVVTGVPQ